MEQTDRAASSGAGVLERLTARIVVLEERLAEVELGPLHEFDPDDGNMTRCGTSAWDVPTTSQWWRTTCPGCRVAPRITALENRAGGGS